MTDTAQAPERIVAWPDAGTSRGRWQDSLVSICDFSRVVEYTRADLVALEHAETLATSGAEARWIEHMENACHCCGGSGHKEDCRADMAAVVKPLEWRQHIDEGDGSTFWRSQIVADYIYEIIPEDNGFATHRRSVLADYIESFLLKKSVEEAKSLAQADYESRVLSTITLRPAAEIRNEALEEAAQVCDGERAVLVDQCEINGAYWAKRLRDDIRALKSCTPKPAENDTQAMLERAYLAGFMESSEGWNGEYPHGLDDIYLSDRGWLETRDAALRALAEKDGA